MLKDAFPSPPGRPGKYVFAIRRVGQLEPHMIMVLAAKYAVKKYLELAIGKDEVIFESPQHLRTSSGLVIYNWNCEHHYVLEDLWHYEYSIEEMAWSMPEPLRSEAMRLRRAPMAETDAPTQHKVKAPREASAPRASRDGLVSIAEIADQMGKEPRELRKILRDKSIAKPAAGWAWPQAEVDAIKAILS